ncbi:octanoyltransferase LipM [bacterium BMS3Abin07]|nr:octanoyltransferase LipM [bacterium BMS3Abin07]GBE32619.1 octanoyltransferase LipM [bacterium BMS3Bbin05]HDL20594.1 lipoate--protein ligase family protein [Nitrospirota bacterium]HDO21585.1 lipoate--protein ligase family protein [Nitrospirota bacterium]HDZ88893.1 lipoate--protein ligase family protein [Nitrospirota bacterium]
MTEKWRYIKSGKTAAGVNMAVDEAIAFNVISGSSPPTLRMYSWDRPSVTIGAFQRLADIDTGFCRENSVPLVRRLTGGRAILHCTGITYSFAAGDTGHKDFGSLLDSYRILSAAFLNAFRKLGLDVSVRKRRERGTILAGNPHCFDAVSFGEIAIKGRKIIGSAQKRFKKGFLQQGDIPFFTDQRLYKGIFDDGNVPAGLSRLYPDIGTGQLKISIVNEFEKVFNKKLGSGKLTEAESRLARDLLEKKYLSAEWTERR